LWNSVLDLDRFVEIAVSHQIKQGSERFVLNDFEVRFCVGQTGRHVTAAGKIRVLETFAAIKNLAALVFQSLDGMLHHVDRILVDQRPHPCLTLERIPNAHRFIGRQKFFANLVGNGLVQNHAPGRSATLAGGADCAEEN
jgi:hypothetical protein